MPSRNIMVKITVLPDEGLLISLPADCLPGKEKEVLWIDTRKPFAHTLPSSTRVTCQK